MVSTKVLITVLKIPTREGHPGRHLSEEILGRLPVSREDSSTEPTVQDLKDGEELRRSMVVKDGELDQEVVDRSVRTH